MALSFGTSCRGNPQTEGEQIFATGDRHGVHAIGEHEQKQRFDFFELWDDGCVQLYVGVFF